MERDPNKRRVKPPANPELVNLDYIDGESSSDSDFRIEDHCINSGSDSDGASNFTYTDGLFFVFLMYSDLNWWLTFLFFVLPNFLVFLWDLKKKILFLYFLT